MKKLELRERGGGRVIANADSTGLLPLDVSALLREAYGPNCCLVSLRTVGGASAGETCYEARATNSPARSDVFTIAVRVTSDETRLEYAAKGLTARGWRTAPGDFGRTPLRRGEGTHYR